MCPCDVILSEGDIVQPDIFFIFKEREHIITERNIQGASNLVVEILPRFTAKLDKTLKTGLYERFGVKEYWLVDPEQKQIEVLALRGQGYESLGIYRIAQCLGSPILKGLKVDLREVF